jgi:plastocyanin
MRLGEWLRTRKTAASITVLAVLLATPITVAVLHEGFPLDDVDLTARDVWLSNASISHVGRLNMQIREFNGSVFKSGETDLLQDGDDVFVHDLAGDSLERVDPSFTLLREQIVLPPAATVSLGGDRISVVAPDRGAVWVVDGSQQLTFDHQAEPLAELGRDSQSVVTGDGTVIAFSTDAGAFVRLDPLGGEPTRLGSAEVRGEYDLTAVGERAALLDRDTNTLVFDDGRRVDGFSETVLRVQQPGAARDSVVVATNSDLLRVGFDGSIAVVASPGENGPATSRFVVAAPVVAGPCTYAAWASSRQYFGVCDGSEPVERALEQVEADARLEFRVNRDVVALNNVQTGQAWLVVDEFLDVEENWGEVLAPPTEESDEVDQTITQQSVAETLAERTEDNHAPVAKRDSLGARPGRTTILPVLDNDSDVDGDVLTITDLSDIGSAGELTIIDDGRALQIKPGAGASGTISFRYTVSDGRTGGTAETQADVAVHSPVDNQAPEPARDTEVEVEAGQTIGYNVLRDWADPDGDDLLVTGAISQTGDTVRFRPDGEVTFTHISSQLGAKVVEVTVSDGTEKATGQVVFDVVAPGTSEPVGTADFVSAFVGRPVEIEPLANDLSPSGRDLELIELIPLGDGPVPEVDTLTGIVQLTGSEEGTSYYQYTVDAGGTTAPGIIRFDVQVDPDEPAPPIAVKDTGYLRPQESVTVPVLLNDLSPSGEVLGVQGFELPSGSPLSVEILGGTVLRVTSSEALTTQESFEYTISDGHTSVSAGVTIVPVEPLTKHQAPIAKGDAVTVRAGDIAAVDVLANDFHPDGSRMTLDPELIQVDLGDGVAFVNDGKVRLHTAPSDDGQFSITYRITDDFDEAATARVVVTVVPDGENLAPAAPPIEARVFQGASLTIDVPLDDLDPDGDSVEFVGTSGAGKGSIDAIGSTSFTYTALSTGEGTDTFFYRVRDALGESAVGEVRIGVIPRSATKYPPSAVLDEVAVRPGRSTEILPLANDSDPNGYEIKLQPDLSEVDPDLVASTDGAVLHLTAPEEPGNYLLQYTVTNGQLESAAYVRVIVDPDAPLLPPVAIDHVIERDDVAGQRSTVVNVFDGAANPGGSTDELVVELEGPGAGDASVGANGAVTVPIGETRRAFTYSLTNEADSLETLAFIVVPAYAAEKAPRLKPELEASPPVIFSDRLETWDLSEILDVPSGRPVILIDEESAVALRSNGDPIAVDEDTIGYTSEQGYRGTSAITFTVTDGESADDPDGNIAIITLPLVVGDPEAFDVAPTFANTTVRLEPNTSQTLNLRDLSDHPNPDVIELLSYSTDQLIEPGSIIGATLTGDQLTLSAPVEDSTGATAKISFVVDFESHHIPATIEVVVVASTKPLPQAVDDVVPEGRSNSTYSAAVTRVLANDFNPFAAEKLPLVIQSSPQFEGDSLGAQLSSTARGISVTTGSAKSGTITVVYRIRDATNDPGREVQGRLTIIVESAPEPVTAIALTPGDETITAVFQPPSSSNGAEITGYTVRISSAQGIDERTDCLPGSACTFTGRVNGQLQTVTVAATNRVGTTTSAGATETPYGIPTVPTGVLLDPNRGTANADITPRWSGPVDDGGGSIYYEWQYTTSNVSGSGSTAGTTGGVRTVGEGTYGFRVRACNPAGCSGWVSDSVTIDPAPPAITGLSQSGPAGSEYCGGAANCRRIVASFTNVPNGSYTFCADGDAPGGGTNRGTWGDVQCYPGTVSGGVSTTPFGLVQSATGYTIWIWIQGVTPQYSQVIW